MEGSSSFQEGPERPLYAAVTVKPKAQRGYKYVGHARLCETPVKKITSIKYSWPTRKAGNVKTGKVGSTDCCGPGDTIIIAF